MSTNRRCSCKTLKNSQCSFNARASKKYCGHHDQKCKNPGKKDLQLSKEIRTLDAKMSVQWKKDFSRLFRLLIELRELRPDMFIETKEKLTLPLSSIGYDAFAGDDDVLYKELYPLPTVRLTRPIEPIAKIGSEKMNWKMVLDTKSEYGPVLIAQNVNIQYLREEKNKKEAPSSTTAVLMTKARFDFLYKETHEGAFGEDYGEVSGTKIPVVKDAEFGGDETVFFVYKFPYDMFGDGGRLIPLDAVVDISLPVGTYLLSADRWFIRTMKNVNPLYMVELNKIIDNPARSVTKFRTTFQNKEVFSILHETSNDVHPTREFPMVNNIPFNDGELWSDPSPESQRKMTDFANECFEGFGLVVFPVWGQHHAAMVFYSHKDITIMSPESLLSLLQNPDIDELFKKYELGAWIDKLKHFVNLRAPGNKALSLSRRTRSMRKVPGLNSPSP